jgi:hypothetical protein
MSAMRLGAYRAGAPIHVHRVRAADRTAVLRHPHRLAPAVSSTRLRNITAHDCLAASILPGPLNYAHHPRGCQRHLLARAQARRTGKPLTATHTMEVLECNSDTYSPAG